MTHHPSPVHTTPAAPAARAAATTPERPGVRSRRAIVLALTVCLLGPLAAERVSRAEGPAGSPPPTPPASASLRLNAKLVEIPGKLPDDELYDYAYVMRYEVVGGPMDKQSILVAHYKPRQPRSALKDKMKSVVSGKVRSFRVGDVHKLELSPNLKSVWKGALVDEFAATDRKSTRYFALVTDPA
jgi:hypothetical protein